MLSFEDYVQKFNDSLDLAFIHRYLDKLHDEIPPRSFVQWKEAVMQSLRCFSQQGDEPIMLVNIGSGPGVSVKMFESLMLYWTTKLLISNTEYKNELMMAVDAGIRRFLEAQHACRVLVVADPQALATTRIRNLKDDQIVMVPSAKVLFASINSSSAPSKSKRLSSPQKDGFQPVGEYIAKHRPAITLIKIMGPSAAMDHIAISTAFNRMDMTMISVEVDALEYGSPMAGTGTWLVAFDVHPRAATLLCMETKFLQILATLKMDSFGITEILINDPVIRQDIDANFMRVGGDDDNEPSPKKAKNDAWKAEHEKFYMANQMKWPPSGSDVSVMDVPKQRDLEIVYAAHHLFPRDDHLGKDVWEWIDGSLGLQRFDRSKEEAEGDEVTPNPWHKVVPCITPQSVLVGRYLDGKVI